MEGGQKASQHSNSIHRSEAGDKAGLWTFCRKGIIVNECLQTSDPTIYAVEDAILVTYLIMGNADIFSLAGPASKQGRIVAKNIAGKQEKYYGSQGTLA